jgi:hypothetical protein
MSDIRNRQEDKKAKRQKTNQKGLTMPIKKREEEGQEYIMGTFLYSIPTMQVQTRKSRRNIRQQEERQECNNKNAIPSWPCRRKESVALIISKPLKPIAE